LISPPDSNPRIGDATPDTSREKAVDFNLESNRCVALLDAHTNVLYLFLKLFKVVRRCEINLDGYLDTRCRLGESQ
jgi:hypothetical protein